MELTKIQITFNSEDTIVCATLTGIDEWVMLLSSGNVLRYRVGESSGEHLFSTSTRGAAAGGFDITAPCSIYTLGSTVVLVNDFKTSGYVHHPDKGHFVHLYREDYHADISKYPIALYNNGDGVPHLIYAVAWNHVQIMNLDTLQILTAAKSLIAEGAEDHPPSFNVDIPGYKAHPWPTRYDYFYGQLLLSPDCKHFLSKGWFWGSSDWYNVYEIDHFLNSNYIASHTLVIGEHDNRVGCWIDNTTAAVAYDRVRDGDEEGDEGQAIELHFLDITTTKPTATKRIAFAAPDGVGGQLHYSKALNALVVLSKTKGLWVGTLDGAELFEDETFRAGAFYPELGCFMSVSGKTVTVYGLGNVV
jgi:hypothetical protein